MKRTFALLLAVVLALLVLSGCKSGVLQPEKIQPSNTIAPMDLTTEERELVKLLTSSHPILFLYKIDGESSHRKFWMEVYQKDKLVESYATGVTIVNDEKGVLTGMLAVQKLDDPANLWSFSIIENGAKANQSNSLPADYTGSTRGQSLISKPVAIEDGKEILLAAIIFSNQSTLQSINVDSFDASQLQNNDFTYLIKCQFSV